MAEHWGEKQALRQIIVKKVVNSQDPLPNGWCAKRCGLIILYGQLIRHKIQYTTVVKMSGVLAISY